LYLYIFLYGFEKLIPNHCYDNYDYYDAFGVHCPVKPGFVVGTYPDRQDDAGQGASLLIQESPALLKGPVNALHLKSWVWNVPLQKGYKDVGMDPTSSLAKKSKTLNFERVEK